MHKRQKLKTKQNQAKNAQWGKLPVLRQIKSSPFFTKCSRFHMNGNSGHNFTAFNFFFFLKEFFFMFTTYLPMAGLKIKFYKYF
jgi:hypothetical protein